MFDNRVLRILGPSRDEEEATGRWTKLHSDILHNMHSSPDAWLESYILFKLYQSQPFCLTAYRPTPLTS
jgi:hypothetical protein